MKLIFYKCVAGNLVDKLIGWYTAPFKNKFNGRWKDGYSHVELLFADGYMFSASQYENSTRFKQHNQNSTNWDRIEVAITAEEVNKVNEFCKSVEKCEYDYWGVAGFVFGTSDSKSKWFCSEVCTAALQTVGLFADVKVSKVSPNELYRMITKWRH